MILYTGNNCPNCKEVKQELEKNNIPYEEKNTSDKTNRVELMSNGFMTVPVLKVGETWLAGLDSILEAIAKR